MSPNIIIFNRAIVYCFVCAGLVISVNQISAAKLTIAHARNEKKGSSMMTHPANDHQVKGEPEFLEESLRKRTDILFFSGFESTDWRDRWGMEWGPRPADNISLVSGKDAFSGKSLRVRYPKGLIGGPSACQFYSSFRKIGITPRDSVYVRYYLRFDPSFEFVKGGKLPGLVGGDGNTGGSVPNGIDGFSARIMWRTGGRIVQYLYHPDQPGVWGEDFDWNYGGKFRFFIPGKWHCVETFLQMNTPGKKDGIVRSWLDSELALDIESIRFRDIPDLKIDAFYFSTFFGGGEPDWAPSSDQFVQFDNFVISENRIGIVNND
ncbi:MAG TPA: hypothetical protein VF857_06180 [Spirochaetota bacterium]